MKKTLLILTILTLSGCFGGGTTLIVGEKRSAIPVSEVKVYFTKPKVKYEEIARLNSSSRAGFSHQYRQDANIENIKERAADFGANAIIIDSSEVEVFTIGTDAVQVKATAIYIP